jgi:hypothetical protein
VKNAVTVICRPLTVPVQVVVWRGLLGTPGEPVTAMPTRVVPVKAAGVPLCVTRISSVTGPTPSPQMNGAETACGLLVGSADAAAVTPRLAAIHAATVAASKIARRRAPATNTPNLLKNIIITPPSETWWHSWPPPTAPQPYLTGTAFANNLPRQVDAGGMIDNQR